MGIFPCVERVLAEYRSLIIKMSKDSATVTSAKSILSTLLDIHSLLALPLLMPLLRSVNWLIKIAQERDCYIVDYMVALQACRNEIWFAYLNIELAFRLDMFQTFTNIITRNSCIVSLEWKMDLNEADRVLSFRIGDSLYLAHFVNRVTRREMPITEVDWEATILQVKK